MRISYSLMFMAIVASSLQAQSSWSAASNANSFYITDTNCADSNPYDGIIWPCDIETINCNVLSDPSLTGRPILTGSEIDQIKISFEDIYTGSSSDCNKIFRRWTVVDTQLYDKSTGKGIWEYIQKIEVLKTSKPVFISENKDQEFCVYRYDCSPDSIHLKVLATDDCTLDLKYSYEIDLNNNGIIDLKGDSNNIKDIFPFGKHKVKWFAKDGCGNTTTCEYFFKVKDCNPPKSNVINGLMVELMSDKGEVTIQAADFDQGSFDNCELEEFRIISPSKGEGQTSPPPIDAKAVTFDCSSKGVNSVDFWVKDISGNWSYATTYVIVQDNNFNCAEVEDATIPLGQKINQFVEEIPLEIEKIHIPANEIQQSEKAGLKIYPNQPNPFDTATKISFDLEKHTKLTFTIQDISGNIIKIIKKEFSAGYNQIILNKEDFEEAGIYFFTIKSITHKATGKIVLIQR